MDDGANGSTVNPHVVVFRASVELLVRGRGGGHVFPPKRGYDASTMGARRIFEAITPMKNVSRQDENAS